MNPNRMLIINSEIQKAVSEIITYDLRNPNITGIVTITKVETTSDLDNCKIYLSIFTSGDKQEVFHQIQHSAGYIRKQLTQKIDLRKTPFLTFLLDNSFEEHFKIEQLIQKANEGKKEE